ncbi:MAG: hypothetical protein Ct9H90mP30_1350 [Actinomycetota bacterium]|nr:MAG: hypothetical protein Ct9H90mP30_1350 [Actinomycetota bacterium]
MTNLVWLIPGLPLIGFTLLLLFGRRLGEPQAGWLATATVSGSFLAAVAVFFGLATKPPEERSMKSLYSNGFHQVSYQ